jgi:signal transduction histidine kinase
MARESGLRARLGRTFLLQAAFIGAAAVISVFLASALLEGVLIRQALRDEAAHFWSRRAGDATFPLPDTVNLRGYIESAPADLVALSPGFHDQSTGDVDVVVYVTDQGTQRLFLVFDRGGVARLATLFGLLPLAAVLMGLYLSAWLAFRASKRAFSPIIALARQVRELNPSSPEPQKLDPDRLPRDADDEVRELSDALVRYSQRLADFIAREREFTRDASHELRSPLTVLQLSSDMLRADESLSPPSRRAAERVGRAARDMDELTTAFLLLAREAEVGLPSEPVCLNDLLADELDRARSLAEGRPIESSVVESCRLRVEAPAKVLSVIFGNLLRNAFSYTDRGEVRVRVEPAAIVIEDTGVGMSPDRVDEMFRPFVRGEDSRRGGHGVGLTIVRRLSDRFGWPLEVESEPGVGTRIRIRFPQALVETKAQGGAGAG